MTRIPRRFRDQTFERGWNRQSEHYESPRQSATAPAASGWALRAAPRRRGAVHMRLRLRSPRRGDHEEQQTSPIAQSARGEAHPRRSANSEMKIPKGGSRPEPEAGRESRPSPASVCSSPDTPPDPPWSDTVAAPARRGRTTSIWRALWFRRCSMAANVPESAQPEPHAH